MNVKKKSNSITTLSGIDALYYQIKTNRVNYTQFYHNILLTGTLDSYRRLERKSQSFTNQYIIYDLYTAEETPRKIATILFKNLCDKDGLEPIKIQHLTTYMNIEGYLKAYHDVVEYIEFLGLQVTGTKMMRIDLNSYVFGIDLDFISFDWFSTLSRNSSLTYTEQFKLVNKETFTLGSRSNTKGVYTRIYDKRAELQANDKTNDKQAMIAYRYLMKYDISLNVMEEKFYNIEFELKRDLLRTYGIDTVEDALSLRYNIMKDIMEKRVRMLISKKNNDGHDNRIDTHPIWLQVLAEYLPNNESYDITRIKQVRTLVTEEKVYKLLQQFVNDNDDYSTPSMMLNIAKILNKRK